MADQTEVQALHDLLQQTKTLDVEGVPVIVAPPGFQVQTLERLQEISAPRGIKRQATANDVRGFIDYVNLYKVENVTHVYAGAAATPMLLARIDDHAPDAPSHVLHSAAFSCPTTHEWNVWTKGANQRFGQVEFAEFVERNVRDIIEPNGATLLTAVLNFQDHGSAKFQSAVRLANGRVQFSFIEKDEADKMEFPERLKLALPVFEGADGAYQLAVKLRYRIKRDDDSGSLILWYELDRPDLVLRQAYDDLIASVEIKTGIHVIRAL
jgi:uncharacterized protein YfdQ (DUF2303 family)